MLYNLFDFYSAHKIELEEKNLNNVNELHEKLFASWLQQRVRPTFEICF